MRKLIYLILVFCVFLGYSENVSFNTVPYQESKQSIIIEKQRSFEGISTKYNGSDFIYKEKRPEKKKVKKEKKPVDYSWLKSVFVFLMESLPYILGLIIVFVILKLVLGADLQFNGFRKRRTKNSVVEVYEECFDIENIEINDFEKLIDGALKETNYRLATRYYFLYSLQKMTDKGVVSYNKDKTNLDYLYEIEDTKTSEQFTYILYLYNYIWYGEFYIDKLKFQKTEISFRNFIKAF